MFKNIILYANLLSFLATAAVAECPVAADLAKGIRFTLETGETETFRSYGEGVVASDFVAADPPANRVMLAHGVYLLEISELKFGLPQPGTRTTYSYPEKPSDLPLPQPGGGWQVKAGILDQGDLRSETQVYDFGAATTIAFGSCSYDMFPIRITYPDDGGNNMDVLHYLPALGISYLAESRYDDTTDVYVYASIEAVK